MFFKNKMASILSEGILKTFERHQFYTRPLSSR